MHLAVGSGSWADGNDNGRPDANEPAEFELTVTNKGTVTLELRSVDDNLSSGCGLTETLRLKQGERHKCTTSRQVRSSAYSNMRNALLTFVVANVLCELYFILSVTRAQRSVSR